MIALARLNAILNLACKKFTKAELFNQNYILAWDLFVQFKATKAAILLADTLKGIIIGMMFDILFTLCHSYWNSMCLKTKQSTEKAYKIYDIQLAEEVSNFNKASLLRVWDAILGNAKVFIY